MKAEKVMRRLEKRRLTGTTKDTRPSPGTLRVLAAVSLADEILDEMEGVDYEDEPESEAVA